MPKESLRHNLMGPVASCLARLFLLRRDVQKLAEQNQPQLATQLLPHLDQLEKQLQLLNKKLKQHLNEVDPTAP